MLDEDDSDDLQRRLEALLAAARDLQASAAALSGAAPEAASRARLSAPMALEAAAAVEAAGMTLTAGQRRLCERIINVFETGAIEGKYGAISIYNDGPGEIRQITYGRSQTTEYGNLGELVEMYAAAGGLYSSALRPYVGKVGVTALTDNAAFKDLLRKAGNEDPVMRKTQDAFFDKRYFKPALKWADDNGFVCALSMLVIYDSFIHSGSILGFLRQRFSERPPASGGDEKVWIRDYVRVRNDWLTNHSNPDVRPSAYRTRDLKREIAAGNWELAIQPIIANGVRVDDRRAGASSGAPESVVLERVFAESVADAAPEFEAPEALAADYDGLEWSEAEPPPGLERREMAAFAAPEARSTAADLATDILATSAVTLATSHVSGIPDDATARDNIVDTAAGRAAKRSSYRTAPGGTVRLDADMLAGMLTLAGEYTFSVSEVCGGEHSSTSRHYAGVAFDVNILNGQRVRASHPDQRAFRRRCAELGATEVLGPGVAGHDTHIHAAWPR